MGNGSWGDVTCVVTVRWWHIDSDSEVVALGLSDFGLLSPTPSNCPFFHDNY